MKRIQHRSAALLSLLLLALLVSACVSTPDSAKENEQAVQAVRTVLEAQQAAWNRGDIEGFMDGYERGETTTFVSGDDITRGWQTVLDRYKQRYNLPGLMGALTFSELEIQPLSPSYALVNGRWQLTRS